MAKAIEKEYGRSVVDGFEVFEVGKEQLKDLLGVYADIDNANKAFEVVFGDRSAFGLVVDTMQHADGGYDEPRLVGWVSSLDSALEIISAEYDYALSFGQRRIYEIWHVEDDGDLWQEWDMEAAAAGGNLQMAQQWEAVFHDDKYLRQIEDQYTGGYDIYEVYACEDSTLVDTVEYDDLHPYLLSPVRYIYNHMDTDGCILRQGIVIPVHAADDVRELKAHGWKLLDSEVLDFDELQWPCLEILRRDGTKPLVSPLRVCNVYYERLD